MGVFDVFENKKRTHERTFGKGARDGSKSRWVADVVHDFKHGPPLFGKRSTYEKSYDAGYHEGRKRKRNRERASTYASVSTESMPVLYSGKTPSLSRSLSVIILCLAFIATMYALKFRAKEGDRVVHHINANELNLRSGPGTSYPILVVFRRGEEIVPLDEQHQADGYVWVRAKTIDGKTEGWIVEKYLSK